MFHSWFVRETLAFTILFLVVYFYILRFTDPSKSINVRNSLLLLLSMIALLFAHHLTFLILLIFLALSFLNPFLLTRIGKVISRWPTRTILLDRIGKAISRWPTLTTKPSSLYLVVPVLALVLFLSYLMFIGEPVFEFLVLSVKALASPVFEVGYEVVMIERTLEEQVKFYARPFFYGAFAFLLINQVLRNRQRNIIWDALGFSSLIVVTAFVAIDILTMRGVGVLRIESLIFPFILIPVAYAICRLRRNHLAIYLLAFFALYQVSFIPNYVYDRNAEPAYHWNAVRMSYTLSTYRAVEWFGGEGRVAAGDMSTNELLGGLRQANVVIDLDLFKGDLNRIRYYDWLVIRAENFRVLNKLGPLPPEFLGIYLTESTFREIENFPDLAKIYAVKDFYFYKVQQ
ncbi:MAG: hypothetical protein DDT33_01659 [Firmicutes bacterium]|nr:hypothetical protein [Bacillota bacterium]